MGEASMYGKEIPIKISWAQKKYSYQFKGEELRLKVINEFS